MKWEVRTMRSGTSYFDRTVFKKTVARFWPLWAAYFAIWLVMLPLNGLMMLRLDSYDLNSFDYMEEFALSRVPATAAANGSLMFLVVFGALAAMAVFSHLYNARSANLFGSLPIRREGLFLTHYLAGLCFLIVPNVVIFLLTLLVELAGGMVCWQGLLFWLAVVCGEGFFFYSLAVFCGLFTGHILALPAFYAIVNGLAISVISLVDLMLRAFYYGFYGYSEDVYAVVEWLTPVAQLGDTVRYGAYWIPDNAVNSVLSDGERVLEIEGLGTVGIYAVAAVVLIVCAFFLYRARHLESAGDVVSVKAMRPVFKYGVALCGGVALGMVTLVFTGGGEIMLMIAMVVWGVIGCFAAQMLLDKSFRVFKKWKGAAAVAAVFIVLFLVMNLDLTGFETRIPDPDRVDSVNINGINAVYIGDDGDMMREECADPEVIRLVTVLHREAVAQRDEERQTQAQIGGVSTSLTLTYRLKGGGTLTRRYTVWLNPDEVDQEGAAAWAVQQLYENHELYWQVYGFAQLEERLAQGYRLERAEYEHYDNETGMSTDAAFYGNDAAALLAAMKEDFFAGRIGVRRVGEERNYGAPDESLVFSVEKGEAAWNVRIAVQDTATSTLAALEEMADRAVLQGETYSYPLDDYGYFQ